MFLYFSNIPITSHEVRARIAHPLSRKCNMNSCLPLGLNKKRKVDERNPSDHNSKKNRTSETITPKITDFSSLVMYCFKLYALMQAKMLSIAITKIFVKAIILARGEVDHKHEIPSQPKNNNTAFVSLLVNMLLLSVLLSLFMNHDAYDVVRAKIGTKNAADNPLTRPHTGIKNTSRGKSKFMFLKFFCYQGVLGFSSLKHKRGMISYTGCSGVDIDGFDVTIQP